MAKPARTERSYVLPIDKPIGPTSHDVVAMARRALGTRRVGHTGTLDPFASGLLLLCVGNATRIAEYLTSLHKTYDAELLLGTATDTDDHTGTAIAATAASVDACALDEVTVSRAFEHWRGTHEQRPSSYSAKKVDGRRAYDAARHGEAVELAPVSITIHDITITEMDLPRVKFTVTCSSGTYIRALARDIGESLGTGAHLTALRRTRIGTHDVACAVPIANLDDAARVERAALTPLDALPHMPHAELNADDLREIVHGRAVKVAPPASDASPASPASDARVARETVDGDGMIALAHDGALVAIGVRDGELIRPKKVLANA
jgi:tRNA pseudouridine55 synthase